MRNPQHQQQEEEEMKPRRQHKPQRETDLPDNEHDAERMKPEEVVLDLPDVEDIPGQEHIHVPQIREMQDVTAASDDEEGVGIFGDEEDYDKLVRSDIPDLNVDERNVLETSVSDLPDFDDENLRLSELDETDDEGDPLNEGSNATDVSGRDMDTSGLDEDDDMEDIGAEDEENNFYSLGGDERDDG